MQDMKEIPAIVRENCDKVLKFSHFWWGYPLVMSLANRQTDRFACLDIHVWLLSQDWHLSGSETLPC